MSYMPGRSTSRGDIFAATMPNPDHLQMIQAVIERMGRNSFLLKGWTVTLVAALVGLAADKASADFALIAVAVSLVLGLLDAYYLAVERNYRSLYEATIASDSKAPPWSLAAGKVGIGDLCSAAASPTVVALHGSAIACAAVVAIVT
jgi:hypothetical protein